MTITRNIRLWFKTRQLERVWWSIPALLAGAAWIGFGFTLMDWKPAAIKAQYSHTAERALAKRDFETARIASQRLLALGADPRARWLFNLALCQAGLGRDREAARLFSQVAPLEKPGFLPAHLFLAEALLMKTNLTSQDIDTAETHLSHALSLDPKFLGANELLAQVYIRQGQWELACERLREVVSTRPETALLLAAVLKARGDNVGAKSWAQRASRYHRERVESSKLDQPKSRLAWAEAEAMLEDYPSAVSILEKGWKQSGDRGYHGPIGEVCAVWLQSVLKNRPADLDTRLNIVQQGLQYAPQNEALLKHLVGISELQGPQAEAARESMTRALAEGKSAAIIHFALGLDAWQRGQADLAHKHFALSYDTAPQMPDVANNMALILAIGEKPDLPRALAIIQSVVEKQPENPNFRDTRGQVLVRLGRMQEAIVDLEFALPLLGSKGKTHAALAEAYKSLGSPALAVKHQQLAKASMGGSGNP
jgi:tetratricopeptide (TPR) repeat protein